MQELLIELGRNDWQTGRIGDTVYMCSDTCFQNTAADRRQFVAATRVSAIDDALGVHAVHTTGDGRFDMSAEGITFSGTDSTEFFFPWSCKC